jgi:hypothetical protein
VEDQARTVASELRTFGRGDNTAAPVQAQRTEADIDVLPYRPFAGRSKRLAGRVDRLRVLLRERLQKRTHNALGPAQGLGRRTDKKRRSGNLGLVDLGPPSCGQRDQLRRTSRWPPSRRNI